MVVNSKGGRATEASHDRLDPAISSLELELRGIAELKKSAPTEAAYFNWLETEENVVESLGPIPLTVVMMARATPAATRLYSMAVAADSS